LIVDSADKLKVNILQNSGELSQGNAMAFVKGFAPIADSPDDETESIPQVKNDVQVDVLAVDRVTQGMFTFRKSMP
jgi:hypothetical protein